MISVPYSRSFCRIKRLAVTGSAIATLAFAAKVWVGSDLGEMYGIAAIVFGLVFVVSLWDYLKAKREGALRLDGEFVLNRGPLYSLVCPRSQLLGLKVEGRSLIVKVSTASSVKSYRIPMHTLDEKRLADLLSEVSLQA